MLNIVVQHSNVIGIIGVVLTLTAYYLLNVNKLSSESMIYLSLNLIGSSLILFSLIFDWNLASVLIESAWIFISMIGMYRTKTRTKKNIPDNIYVINNAKKNIPAYQNI